VEYSNRMPVLDHFRTPGFGLMKGALLTKSDRWCYESDARCLKRIGNGLPLCVRIGKGRLISTKRRRNERITALI